MMEPFKNDVLIFLLTWQSLTIHSDNTTCPPQPKETSSHSCIMYLAVNHPCGVLAKTSYCLDPSPCPFTFMPKETAHKIENHRLWSVTNTDESQLQVFSPNLSLKVSFCSSEKCTSILHACCHRYGKQQVITLKWRHTSRCRCKFITISAPDYELSNFRYFISSP